MEASNEPSQVTPPVDATTGSVEYHRYVRKKVEQGFADVEAGRVLTMGEMRKRFAAWLDDYDPN
jgi:hypothetical protein